MGSDRTGRIFSRIPNILFGLAAIASGQLVFAQAPPATAFATLPAMESPSISTDGKRLAFITHSDDSDVIIVAELGTTIAVTTVIDTGQSSPRSVEWASDDSLFFMAGAPTSMVFAPNDPTSPWGIDLNGEPKVTRLLQNRGATTRGGGGGGRFGGGNAGGAQLVGYDRKGGNVLFPKFDFAEGERVLYAVDAKRDRQRVVDRGSRSSIDWVVNAAGEPVYRLDSTEQPNRFLIMGRPNDRWEVLVAETGSLPQLSFYGLDDAGRLIVGVRPEGRDTLGLYTLSPTTGQLGEAILTDDRYDVSAVRLDPYTNLVVGASVGGQEPVWLDAELAEHQSLVDEAFPGESPEIVSWSEKREKMIIRTESGNRAPAYYVYDTAAPSVDQIADAYPALLGVELPQRSDFSYQAQDGTTIPAYLTRPRNAAGPTPAVLLPHAGPAARDKAGFDWLAHFLATRGYTVLQPNFRGSAGLGRAWAMGGGRWGTGAMQSDLSDGVAALVEQGLADPERVCIVGSSYGGYAALAGAAFTPDLYRCAAAIGGISDLVDMVAYVRESTGGARSPAAGIWRQAAGAGPDDDLNARLRELSPAAHVDQLRAPVLLIHERDDAVVPIAQSQKMAETLRAAGKDVELVEIDGADHWLASARSRLAALQALEKFLAEQL